MKLSPSRMTRTAPSLLLLLLLLLLVLGAIDMQYAHAASPSEIAPKIIEGQTASLGKFPFAVHLFVNGYPECGGSLIAYKWVLTAAHCVTSTDYTKGTYKVYNTNYIKIGYGTYENTENNTVSVKNIIVHPDFDHITYVRDIALIELDTDLEQTNNTRPVLISNSTLSSGQNLTVVGWGQTSNNDYTPAKTLMEAQMTTLPDDDCKAALSTYEGQNGSNICMSHAAQPGVGICNGDSGGPLLIEGRTGYELVGLVSYDTNPNASGSALCAAEGIISFFTNVRVYMEFISQVTGIAEKDFVDGTLCDFTQIGTNNTVACGPGGEDSDGDNPSIISGAVDGSSSPNTSAHASGEEGASHLEGNLAVSLRPSDGRVLLLLALGLSLCTSGRAVALL